MHAGAQDYISRQYIDDAGLINRTLRHAIERHQLKLGLEKTRDRESFLAHYDQCTALPNRLLFLDRIHQTIAQARRNQTKFALFFVDLDRFKHVNDAIGHSAGDEVLRCVGQRMTALVRDSDTVARFGGDEFVLILQASNDNEAMKNLAEKLIDAINQPIPYGHHQCSVGASIGIACYPRHSHSPEQLMKNADIAMYEAKNSGRNQSRFFTQELFERKNHFFNLEKALRKALLQPDSCFEMEITEGVLLADTQQVHGHLAALKSLGIGLALDDFGAGFSSLSYLSRFPINTLKIDGSFICDRSSSQGDRALLKAIVSLGKALDMKVVAECIEQETQKQFLLDLCCNEGQGLYWGQPSADWSPTALPYSDAVQVGGVQ